MTTSILDRAYARRDAALQEAAEWEAFIQRYRQLADEPPASAPLSTSQSSQGSAEREIPADSELGKTVNLAEEILDERGPLPLGILYKEITERGLAIGGKSPSGNLGARLHNSGRFYSINKKTGWWFKDRPVPREDDQVAETPNSGELFGAPKTNGAMPLSP